MPTVVNIPGVGQVRFRDMTPEQIEAESQSLYDAKQKELQPKPSALDSFADTVVGLTASVGRGIKAAQNIPESMALTGVKDAQKPSIGQERRAFERAMSDPRYQDALTEAGDDATATQRAESLFGPTAKLDTAMTPQVARQEAVVQDVAKQQREMAALPKSEAQERLSNARTTQQKWQVWLRDPVELTTSIALESLPPSIAGALIGAPAGPGGVALGAGTASGLSTFSSELLGAAGEQGVDVRDPAALLQWVRNGEAFDKAVDNAITKSAIIGTIDAATAKMAGQFVKPALRDGFQKFATASAKELGVQMAGGAGGEALGQVATGQKLDTFDIAMEAVAEAVSTPGEVLMNLAERNHLPATAAALRQNAETLKTETLKSEQPTTKSDSVSSSPVVPPPAETVPDMNRDTVSGSPVPETATAITKQLEVTADPNSTKAVTLVTPGSPMPEVPEGLTTVETPHGTAILNPEKTTVEAVTAAGAGKDFDGTLLGMSQPAKPEPVGNTVVQTTKDGVPVLDEVVAPTPEAIAAATEAHKAAVPGGETKVVPAEKVLEERTTKAPRAEKKAKRALVKLSLEDKSDPRMDEPGVTRVSTPNMIVIQLRDLQSRPMREVQINPTGDDITDAANVVQRISKEQVDDPNVSYRESSGTLMDENGLGVTRYTNTPNGPAWTSVAELIKAREAAKVEAPKQIEASEPKLTEQATKEPETKTPEAQQESGRVAGSADKTVPQPRGDENTELDTRGASNSDVQELNQRPRVQRMREKMAAGFRWAEPGTGLDMARMMERALESRNPAYILRMNNGLNLPLVKTFFSEAGIESPKGWSQKAIRASLENWQSDKPKAETPASFPTLLEFAKLKLPKAAAEKVTREAQVQSFRAQWEKEKAAFEKTGVVPKELTEKKPTDTPAVATEKMQEQVTEVAKTEGTRPAKEIKSELVQRLEEALKKAPQEARITNSGRGAEIKQLEADRKKIDGLIEQKKWSVSSATAADPEVREIAKRHQHANDSMAGLSNILRAKMVEASKNIRETREKITIQIPGDGTFTIVNSKPAIEQVLKDARKLSTADSSGIARAPRVGDVTGHRARIDKIKEDARKVYGDDRRAIETLRRQAEDKELELDENQRKDLLEATEEMEEALPENKLKKEIQRLEDELTDMRETLAMAEEKLPQEVATAKQLRDEVNARLKEGKATKKAGDAAARAEREVNSSKLYIKQRKEGVERLEAKLAEAKEKLAKLQPKAQPTNVNTGALGESGMGGAKPAEFEPKGGTATGIRNAQIEKENAAIGKPPIIPALRRTWGAAFDMAMARLDQDPGLIDKLIAELEMKPRAIDDWENALLAYRRADMKNEYAKLTRELAQAYDDGRMEEVELLKQRVADMSDQLYEFGNLTRGIGTMSGRSLAARKMMVDEKLTLADMEMELRAAKGGERLTWAEMDEVKRLHAEIEAAQKAFEERMAAEEARLAEVESKLRHRELLAEQAKEKLPSPHILQLAERIVKQLDERADAARKRLNAKMGRTSAGVDPTILLDLAEIGASHIGHIGLDFAKWSARMIADVGDWVKPHLQEVFNRSQESVEEIAKGQPEAVKRVIQRTKDTLDDIKAKIGDRIEAGKKHQITGQVQRLARELVKDGIRERNELIDAVHAVLLEFDPEITRREAMDAISGYGAFKQLSKDEASVVLRDLKGQMQQVGKLEDMAGGKAPQKTGVERRTPSDEERRLIKQVEEAKRRGGYAVTDPARQLKSALDAIKTRLRNEISDLEHQIATRQKIVKTQRSTAYDAEAKALKAQRDVLKAEFEQLFPKPGVTDAQLIERMKARLNREIAELERRMAAGDFNPMKKPARVLPLDTEAAQLKAKHTLAKEKYHKALARAQYRAKSRAAKIYLGAKEALNLSRAVLTSWDVSAVFRQGGFIVLGNPVRAAKSLGDMFRALRSEQNATATNEQILARPNAPLYAQAKLFLAPMETARLSAMEEAFMSRLATKIPGVGASQRAYVTFLNKLRADTFDALTATLTKDGNGTLEEMRAIADYVNVATGRGNMYKAAAAAEFLSTLFFAPRLVASRFQLIFGQPLYHGSWRTRRMIAQEYGKFLIGLAVVYALGKLAGADEEEDPRSSDFGKMKFGHTRVDPMAGLSQATVLLSRLTTGETKTMRGKIEDIRGEVKYGRPDSADIIARFLRSKLSPTIGSAVDVATGENIVGEPVTAKSVAINATIPLSFRDIYDVLKEHGIAEGAALAILSAFGMSVQHFDETKKK